MALSVRKTNAEHTFKPEETYVPDKIRKAKQKYLYEAETRAYETVCARDKAAKEFTLRQILVIAAALLACFGIFGIYLMVCSSNKALHTENEKTKRQYYSLVSENSLLRNQIEKDTDLESVYVYATEKLGMAAAEKYQYLPFEDKNYEYVVKSGSIPKE